MTPDGDERRRVTVLPDGPAYDLPDGPVSDTESAASATARILVSPLPGSPEDRATGRQRVEVVVDGWRFEMLVEPTRVAELRSRAGTASAGQAAAGRLVLRAQIPGRVVSLAVAAGDHVEAGQRLLSVEAMKMENEVRAPRAGTIERIAVAAGQRLELGDELVVIA